MKRLLLVDGHNFLWRATGAPFRFVSERGTPLHITTTFLSLLRRTASALLPSDAFSHIAVVFDAPGATTNHLLSDSYKANRVYEFEHEEDSPFFHLPFIKKSLRFLKISFIEKKGHEADDVIGTLATRFASRGAGHRVYIASTDSDFYQLLSPRIHQLVPTRDGDHRLMDPRALIETLGVTPAEYVYFKSLVGDSADNVPGVPGIGRVRAAEIIRNMRPFDPEPHRERLSLNEKLIRLTCTLKLKYPWEKFKASSHLLSIKTREIFEKLRL